MLGSGALRRHVLSSCTLLSTYVCSHRVSNVPQYRVLPSSSRKLTSLSWQVQHAKQGILLPGLSYGSHQATSRFRRICTSIICKADAPKTVREIVRELKKGTPNMLSYQANLLLIGSRMLPDVACVFLGPIFYAAQDVFATHSTSKS